jgi:transposase-like protein
VKDRYSLVISTGRPLGTNFKKWTMPIRNWNLALSQLAIFFEGRLDEALEL